MVSSNGPDDPTPPPETEPPPPGGDVSGSVSFAGWELPPQLDFLRNRLLLAGFAVLAVLLLTAIVLVMLGGSSNDDDASASANTTPDGTAVSTPSADFTARLLTTATMRAGPGLGYAIMGTVPEGAVVVVVGRNEDNAWLQIVYPPGSQLRGWVPVDQVELTGDIEGLSVEGPAEGPDVPTDLPVYTPWTATPPPFTPPPQNTIPRPPTATPVVVPTNTPPLPTNTRVAPTSTPAGP